MLLTLHHLSPHTEQLCQLSAPWHVWKTRGQITQEHYKNTFNSSLSCVEKKYLCTKGVDLKLLVFIVNLCQPVFPEKNVVYFGKQCTLAGPSYEEVSQRQRCATGHSLSLALQQLLSCFLRRAAVRLATRVCRCRILLRKGKWDTALSSYGESSPRAKQRHFYKDYMVKYVHCRHFEAFWCLKSNTVHAVLLLSARQVIAGLWKTQQVLQIKQH